MELNDPRLRNKVQRSSSREPAIQEAAISSATLDLTRSSHPSPQNRTSTLLLISIAAAIALLHAATNGRYGFHRDELQFLSDALHLDRGFIAYPPFTPLIERASLAIFGLWMPGLRLASVFAQALAVIITGLMARELGGRRLAQVAAALSVALSPLPLFEGTEFQYSTFDYLWWTLAAYFLIRLLKSEDPRWWLAVGAALGSGLETKYSIVFFIAGILGGLLLTPARRYFLNAWFWAGFALAIAIFLPNLLWQIQHKFISYHFLQSIHQRDVRIGRGDGFLKDQVLICINLIAAPLALTGFIAAFRSSRYRLIAWMYLIPLTLFFLAKGRGYYLAAAYPMLLAIGAATAERWLLSLTALWRRLIQSIYFTALIALGAYVCAILIPIATSGPLKTFALSQNGDLREEIGWNELVSTVASIRDSLPAAQQQSLGIVVDNYGEAGAIEILGVQHHLPAPVSKTNSGWLRTYPAAEPTTLIVLGMSPTHANDLFTNCRIAGHNRNSEGIKNEESEDHPDIFVCGPPRTSWSELWQNGPNFG